MSKMTLGQVRDYHHLIAARHEAAGTDVVAYEMHLAMRDAIDERIKAERDAARLDWVAQYAYAMRSARCGRRNAFVWDHNYPTDGSGVIRNLRASIDAAMQESGEWTEGVG